MSKHNTRSNASNKNGEQIQECATIVPAENLFDLVNEEDPTLKDIYKVVKGMSLSLQFLSEGYEDFKIKIRKLENENVSLKNETETLHKRLQYIESDYYSTQQQQLLNHITIHGVPQQKPDEIANTIINIANTLNVNITSSNIKSCRSMNNQNNTNPSPIIIVEFNDLDTKQKIQANYKNNGPLIVSQVLKNSNKSNSDHRKIYINDYLCTYFKQLLDQTKKIQVQCNIKFVWTKNGCVFARYNEKAPIIKIRNYNDIKEILEETNSK